MGISTYPEITKEIECEDPHPDFKTVPDEMDYIYDHLDVDIHSYDHAINFTGIGKMTVNNVIDFRNEEMNMSYQKDLLAVGLSQEQITIIENTTMERVMGDYFFPDEHYPLAPVNFLKEWEKNKMVVNGIELHIKDWPDDYLTMVDEKAEQYAIRPERIIDAIRNDMDKYIKNLIAVMPTINPEYLPDYKMVDTTNRQEKIDRAVEMFDEDYYAADILKEIHKSVTADNPKMTLDEQIDSSIFILRMAEEKFYNAPITPRSILHDMYKDMKSTVNDFKDMMKSINKLTSKGKAIAQKALNMERAETKAR